MIIFIQEREVIMDIQILLWFQDFRNGVGSFLAPYFNWVTQFSVSFWPIAMMCMLYWVLDRKNGKRILGGFGLGLLMNGFLKLIFCVYRPWIRDSRIEPYGDSKVAATGYSFPSGHTTFATGAFGGVGYWMLKHKKKIITCVLWFLVISTMISRNYLGVHTPQDVIVGFISTSCMLFVANKVENWSDQDINRDKIILIGGVLFCVALVCFYTFKSYPMTYLDDGSLLVDPVKMRADSFEGIGFISSFVICRYFERRGFDFEKINWKDRFIVGAFALIPLYFYCMYLIPCIMEINRFAGKYLMFAGIVVYTLIVVPNIMKYINNKKMLES